MTKQIINVGSAEQAGDGESIRSAFIKINENFTEVYAQQGIGDRLVNGTKQVVLDANGTLTVPYPSSDSFRIRLDSANFVPRVGKATLTLTGTAWDFYGAFVYSQDGQTQLAADTGPLPSIDNPGYTDGDTFEIDSTAHGIAGYILTVELSNVVQAGPAGWTASLAFSEPPEYPSTITSLGAIKFTSNESSLVLGTNGDLILPVNGGIIFDRANTSIRVGMGFHIASGEGVDIQAIDQTDPNNLIYKSWYFNPNGSVQHPGGITQSSQDSTSCPAGADTVIYTATGQYQHAIKLFVMVEGAEGESFWHTQACDIIAVRGYNDTVVHVTIYGVTYSSANTLATFDGQWNATTNRIEITCRPTSLTNNVVASVHAIEMTSND